MNKYILLIILLFSINFVYGFEQSKFDFEYPGASINYSLIPTVNSSNYWDNLDTPSDINHNDLNNLEWSNAGHTMDTTLNMNSNNITGIDYLNVSGKIRLFMPPTYAYGFRVTDDDDEHTYAGMLSTGEVGIFVAGSETGASVDLSFMNSLTGAEVERLRIDGVTGVFDFKDNDLENIKNLNVDENITASRLGINTATPLTSFHMNGSSIGVDASDLVSVANMANVLIESPDSYLSLFSDDGANYGSAIIMAEMDGSENFVNEWSMIRKTTTGGNDLLFSYGTDKDPWNNAVKLQMTSAGKLQTNSLSSITGSIDVSSDIDMNSNDLWLDEGDSVKVFYNWLELQTEISSNVYIDGSLSSSGVFSPHGLNTGAYDITTTTGKHKANNLIIDGGFPSIPNVIGIDNNGAVSGSLYIGGFDEGGGDVFYNLQSGYIYFQNLLLGDGTTKDTNKVSINGILTLTEITLPACATATNGSIGRNSSGVYGCSNAGVWTKIF